MKFKKIKKVGLNDTPNRVRDECSFNNNTFLIISSMLSFYIPTIMMIGLYYKIFKVIRNRTQNSKLGQNKFVLQLKKLSIKKKSDTKKSPSSLSIPNNDGLLVPVSLRNSSLVLDNEISLSLMSNDPVKQDEVESKTNIKPAKLKNKKPTPSAIASKKEKKVTKTLAIVLIVYLVCW